MFPLKSKDAAFLLSYDMIQLNTDGHNAQIKVFYTTIRASSACGRATCPRFACSSATRCLRFPPFVCIFIETDGSLLICLNPFSHLYNQRYLCTYIYTTFLELSVHVVLRAPHLEFICLLSLKNEVSQTAVISFRLQD